MEECHHARIAEAESGGTLIVLLAQHRHGVNRRLLEGGTVSHNCTLSRTLSIGCNAQLGGQSTCPRTPLRDPRVMALFHALCVFDTSARFPEPNLETRCDLLGWNRDNYTLGRIDLRSAAAFRLKGLIPVSPTRTDTPSTSYGPPRRALLLQSSS